MTESYEPDAEARRIEEKSNLRDRHDIEKELGPDPDSASFSANARVEEQEREARRRAVKASMSLVEGSGRIEMARRIDEDPRLNSIGAALARCYEQTSEYILSEKKQGHAFDAPVTELWIAFGVMRDLAAEGPQPNFQEFVSKQAVETETAELYGLDKGTTLLILENSLAFLKKAMFAKDITRIALKHDSSAWRDLEVSRPLLVGITLSRELLGVLRPPKPGEKPDKYDRSLMFILQELQYELISQSGKEAHLPRIAFPESPVELELKRRRRSYLRPVQDPPEQD